MDVFIQNFTLHDSLYQATLIFYGLATLLFLGEIVLCRVWKNKIMRYFSSFVFLTALIVQLIWFFRLWHVAGRAPIRTRYESLILYCICVGIVYLFVEILFNIRIIGLLSSFACFAILVYATINRDLELVKLPPALQSGWFVPHVVAYFFAYGSLTVASFCAFLYIIKPSLEISKPKGLVFRQGGETASLNFEEVSYEIIRFGFTMLTFGLILGSVWAKFAWGTYWGWDPKENWALVTWLIYMTYLHLRYIPAWKGRMGAIFVVLGYLAIMFTYLGMKYLPTAKSSLHVYQG
ncbi:MAG: c-type cytochrome biogenesis protein CcsB [Planctomycetota bacterium]|nr:MAG: c-type cytochrome biogenesis protein CcsB [Planctomycetota bacterium]